MLAELRWLDALDIALITGLVYAVIVWLRRSRALPLALGFLMLGLLYLAARLLDLELTTRVFQALFAVSVLVAVVVFQEELRQAFEELASWVLRRGHETQPRLDTRDILVEWLFELAAQRRGALVVLPGRRLLDRYVRGGIELDGKLSGALLQSLFDPHSDGHDGAALVANRRIERFGVHLPLSRRGAELDGARGTRHSAALGLAERTDALCLVVSEERGTLAAAQDGELLKVTSREQLGRIIDRFYRSRHPLFQSRPGVLQILSQDRAAKLISVATATLLWALLVPGSHPAEITLPIPVEVRGLPEELELEEVEPAEIRATLRGRRRDLLLLDDESLRLRVDASLAALGRRTFEISAHDVQLPSGMAVQALQPKRVRISLR
ncbi:MAG: diadenylate cyclase [Myxococcota bacterium]